MLNLRNWFVFKLNVIGRVGLCLEIWAVYLHLLLFYSLHYSIFLYFLSGFCHLHLKMILFVIIRFVKPICLLNPSSVIYRHHYCLDISIDLLNVIIMCDMHCGCLFINIWSCYWNHWNLRIYLFRVKTSEICCFNQWRKTKLFV